MVCGRQKIAEFRTLRSHVWRSHDPTSIQNFDFCEEKSDYPPFFILHLFIVRIFFLSFKKMQLMEFLFIPSAWLSAPEEE